MRLKATWQGNDDGSSDVLRLSEGKTVDVWLELVVGETEKRPYGKFDVEAKIPPSRKGGEEFPHYGIGGEQLSGDVKFTFNAAAADAAERFSVDCKIKVVPNTSRIWGGVLLCVAIIELALGLWTVERALGAFWDIGAAKSLLVTGIGAIVTATGIHMGRALDLIWHWRRCLVVCVASALFVGLPQIWIGTIVNATDDEVTFDADGALKLPPRSVTIVRRSVASSNANDPQWRKERFLCQGVSKACPGCCDFKSVTEPVWAYLFAAPITLGCVVGTTTPTLGVASWRPAKGCKPAADLSVKLAVRDPAKSASSNALVAELVFQPFESEAVRTTSSLDKLFDVTGYRVGSAETASSDLVLELSGTHALKTTRLRLANQAAASAQIALPVLTSGDRTLLGVARLGDVAVGKLACILDGTAPATIHLLHGTRYLRRTLLFNAQGEMQSSFEVERPELGVETPICWGNAISELQLVLDPSWRPGLSIQLPQGLTVPQITAFTADGQVWGTLTCNRSCAAKGCSIAGFTLETNAAVRNATWSKSSKTPGGEETSWSSGLDGSARLARSFLSCGAAPAPIFTVAFDKGGSKSFDSDKQTLTAIAERACAIDPDSGNELIGQSPAKCTRSASGVLGSHPVAGCDKENSKLCP